ncbi:ATP-dependent DNA ligase [Phenylobacterium sp.]|jgi:ATP-dependent DNA ligase|uniref:ATP-dependent DNA ligase n=1 Tax=Phenylobacterium sp. TaxID=1871053 RepID=UPI002F94D28D
MPTLLDLPLPTSFATMEAKLVDEIPKEAGWRYEPKWDGFRCLAFKAGDEVDLRAKSGKPLGRYFPEVAQMLRELPVDRFIVDGELIIETGGELSFDALQLRLHPAESRINKLAAQTPAAFVLFDCLMDEKGQPLADAPFTARRAALEKLFKRLGKHPHLRLSPGTTAREEACSWLMSTGAGLDGVVAKRLDGPYVPGERAMLKIKRMRTADCVVGGFRYAQGSKLVGSLLLGLYDGAGKLNHVGFTSTISNAERPELTKRLESFAPGPGFTGSAPGGPSRWSNERSTEWTPLRHELVVEVRYDHITGGRFRHGTKLVRWRPDKRPDQCTYDQLGSGGGAALEALRASAA